MNGLARLPQGLISVAFLVFFLRHPYCAGIFPTAAALGNGRHVWILATSASGGSPTASPAL